LTSLRIGIKYKMRHLQFGKASTATTLMVLLVFSSTGFATTFAVGAHYVSHMRPASLHMLPQDPSFSPNAPVGGVPFCSSGALGTILCYPPQWLNTAYGFPAIFDGSESTIVIVDAFGSPTAQADLNKYSTTFGLPSTSITILCGPTWSGASTDKCPDFNPDLPIQQLCGSVGWWEETTLDLQMSHAMATGAKIVLVVSDDCFDTSFNSAELAVVQQAKYKGSIMSQSFGEPDDLVGCLDLPCTTRDPTIKADADHIYQLAAQNQWTVLASSGDDGANEALSAVGTTELTPSWPASNPFNTAVGGTQGNPYGGQYGPVPGRGHNFSCAANTVCNTGLVTVNGGANGCGTATRPGFPSSCTPAGYGDEASWQEHTWFGNRTSSGGGVSSLYPLPAYQKGTVPSSYKTLFGQTVQATGRLNPDISLNAAIHGGVLIWVGFLGRAGLWAVFGGTSASSPGFAAIVAVANQQQGTPVGFINPTIYALNRLGLSAGSFHDVTIGNNSDTDGQQGVDGFVSTVGYDLTTGWGTPRVAAFITNLLTTLQQEGQA
jgi:subtilase family serine protease